MRILQLHVDWVEYEPIKKEIEMAEEAEKKVYRIEDAILLLTCVEKGDEEKMCEVVIEDIEKSVQQIGCKKVVFYPYAHLSNQLAPPSKALNILQKLEELALERGLEVIRAPFGWTKALRISVKPHPLAEQFKTFESNMNVMEETSKFIILDVDGKEYEIDVENWEECEVLQKFPLLKILVRNEVIGKPPKGIEPAHIKVMRKLELVDYEPMSDVGHLKFYPNGTLIHDLLRDFAFWKIVHPLKCMKVDTPALYRANYPRVKELCGKFDVRIYKLKVDNVEFVLRPAAGDLGVFEMLSKATISWKNLPFSVYDYSHCYRLEQRGECTGLKRNRYFWMPDIHSFCKDLEEGKKMFEELSYAYSRLMDALDIEYAFAWRVVKDWYPKLKDLILRILKNVNKPALIELLPGKKHYWVMKNEWQAIGSDGFNAQVSTVQLDLENSERFGIYYVDKDGRKKGCIIVHSSIGSIERQMYAILETAVKREKEGKLPMLPLWLSPEQVRVIPVSERHLEKCVEICDILEKNKVRVGLDDRSETVSKKVFEAKRSWIPYIVVVGDKELESGKLNVVKRELSTVEKDHKEEMSVEELIKEIREKCGDMPFRPMYVPREMSKRISFVPWGGD